MIKGQSYIDSKKLQVYKVVRENIIILCDIAGEKSYNFKIIAS